MVSVIKELKSCRTGLIDYYICLLCELLLMLLGTYVLTSTLFGVNGQLFYFHTQTFKSLNTALQCKEDFEGLISELIQEQIMNLYVLEC